MRFEDFGWDDIVLEAPDDTSNNKDDLSTTDYTDTDNLEVEAADEKDLGPTDYANEDEIKNNQEEPVDNEDTENEPPVDGNSDEMSEEGNLDEAPEDEQNVNPTNDGIDSQQNKYLIHDFIELHARITEILDKLRTDKKMSSFINPSFKQVKLNIEKLRDVVYDYITDKFEKETYISNLYQFNLIIQALNINVQMLEEIESKINKGKDSRKNKK